jgi:hypothetical protein
MGEFFDIRWNNFKFHAEPGEQFSALRRLGRQNYPHYAPTHPWTTVLILLPRRHMSRGWCRFDGARAPAVERRVPSNRQQDPRAMR